jgi:hypothetical protein
VYGSPDNLKTTPQEFLSMGAYLAWCNESTDPLDIAASPLYAATEGTLSPIPDNDTCRARMVAAATDPYRSAEAFRASVSPLARSRQYG